MTILKTHRVLFLILFLNIVTHLVWVFNTDYITYGDARVYVPETQRELVTNAGQIYNSNSSLGSIELSGGTKAIELVHGMLAKYNINYPISFRIIYLYPFTLLAPVILYFFFRKFLKSEIGVFLACIVFLFNTYTLILQTAGVLMLMGNLFTVLLLLFYYKFFYEEKSVFNFLMIVLAGFLISTYEFRIFYLACILTSFFVLHYFVFTRKDLIVFLWHGLIIAVVLGLNLHWLLPIFSLGKISSNELFSRGLFGSGYFDITSSLLLFHLFWTFGKPAAFVNQPIPLYFWLIPAFVLGGIWFSRKDKFSLLFLFFACLGVFLTKQKDIPFTQVYEWLYRNFPGFNAFREASKFYFLTVLGYSGLIGFFAEGIKNSKIKLPIYKYFIYFAVFVVFFANVVPLLSGKIGTLFIPRKIPQEYISLNKFLENDPADFRVLWVPINSKWGVYTNKHPAVTAVSIENGLSYLEKTPEYVNYTHPANSVVNILRQSYSEDVLDNMSVKYIVVPMVDLANDDNFFSDYGNNRDHYIQILNSLPFLTKLDPGYSSITVYRNVDYKPRLYITNSLEAVATPKIPLSPETQVYFSQVSPTMYKIKIHNLDAPRYLNFSEAYSTGWKLFPGDVSWKDLLFKDVGSTYNIVPTSTDFHLSSFYIDPTKLGQNANLTKDGNGDISFTLLYWPQVMFYAGLILSFTTAGILLLIAMFALGKYVFE